MDFQHAVSTRKFVRSSFERVEKAQAWLTRFFLVSCSYSTIWTNEDKQLSVLRSQSNKNIAIFLSGLNWLDQRSAFSGNASSTDNFFWPEDVATCHWQVKALEFIENFYYTSSQFCLLKKQPKTTTQPVCLQRWLLSISGTRTWTKCSLKINFKFNLLWWRRRELHKDLPVWGEHRLKFNDWTRLWSEANKFGAPLSNRRG